MNYISYHDWPLCSNPWVWRLCLAVARAPFAYSLPPADSVSESHILKTPSFKSLSSGKWGKMQRWDRGSKQKRVRNGEFSTWALLGIIHPSRKKSVSFSHRFQRTDLAIQAVELLSNFAFSSWIILPLIIILFLSFSLPLAVCQSVNWVNHSVCSSSNEWEHQLLLCLSFP